MGQIDIPRALKELADRYPWYEFIAKKQSPPYDKYRTNPNFVEDRLDKLKAIQEPQKKAEWWIMWWMWWMWMFPEPQQEECKHEWTILTSGVYSQTTCRLCWKIAKDEPQQKDKKIEPIWRIVSNFQINWINYWIEWYKELTEKINEIISYLNNR